MVTIAHISDPHVGSPFFVPNLMNRVIKELNELSPDAVVCTGDLTTEGYRQEYKNWLAYAERIEAPIHTVPGNHDSRNVGYLHFEDLIGPRMWTAEVDDVRIVGSDSSEPDLNEGKVGRMHYEWISRQFQAPAALKVLRAASPPAADPGHRSRAEHGDGCRRPPRGADPRGRRRRALGAQACSRTSGASRRCTSRTPAPCRPCGSAGTRSPATTCWSSTGARSRSSGKFPFGDSTVMAHFALSGEEFHRAHELPVQERTVPVGD